MSTGQKDRQEPGDVAEAKAAVEAMLESCGDAVYRTCLLYLGDRASAEDAVQETFLKAFQRYHTFQGKSSEKTWLVRIAINTCKDQLRSSWARRVQLGFSGAEEGAALGEGSRQEEGERALIEKERKDTLSEQIANLPEAYREAVILYYYHGLKLSEVGDILGITEKAAKTRVARGRKRLASSLGQLEDHWSL